MSRISLLNLISKLNKNVTIDNFKNFRYKLPYKIEDYSKSILLNNDSYGRNVIFKNEIFECVLISWKPGDFTKLHSHPENGCIMKILEGNLHETLLDNSSKFIENDYTIGDVSYIDNKIGKHIISNISNKMTISLHLYSPPNFYT